MGVTLWWVESLAPGSARLWVATVDREMGLRARAMLSQSERDEVSTRIGVEADRRAVALAMRGSVLRAIAPTEARRLVEVDETGVRRLAAAPALAFSATSHDDVVAMAVANVDALGIDVEPVHDTDWDAAIDDVLSEDERRRLEAVDVVNRERAYFECWTVKESVMKALGDGLSDRAPDSIEVLIGSHPPGLQRLDGGPLRDPWAIETIEPVTGYVLSIAVRGRAHIEIESRTWTV